MIIWESWKWAELTAKPSWFFKEIFGQHSAENFGDTLQWPHYVQFFLKQTFFRFSSKRLSFLLYQIYLGENLVDPLTFVCHISLCCEKESSEEVKKLAPESKRWLQSWGGSPILTPLTPCHFTPEEKHSQQADRGMTNLHSIWLQPLELLLALSSRITSISSQGQAPEPPSRHALGMHYTQDLSTGLGGKQYPRYLSWQHLNASIRALYRQKGLSPRLFKICMFLCSTEDSSNGDSLR